MLSDICGSSKLFEVYGDIQGWRIVSNALNLMARLTSKYEGNVVKTIGDQIMCVFKEPSKAVRTACEINRSLALGLPETQDPVKVKTSLHFGNIFIEQDDIFGDSINVAAKMLEMTKPEQILISNSVADALSKDFIYPVRNLGETSVRGKYGIIGIYEVIWQNDISIITKSPPMASKRASLFHTKITLKHKGFSLEGNRNTPVINLGRGPENDMIIDKEIVSRRHAAIEFRNGKFMLIDRSTNGTYVTIESGDKFLVQREEIPLFGSGSLSLGTETPENLKDLIHFQIKL